MSEQGSKKVPIAGVNDERRITILFGISLDGFFLPPQLIYQRESPNCLPQIRFHVTGTLLTLPITKPMSK